ncbi:hypothetical protein [Haliangium ochraceum]|uniref:Lipase chaperone n=1 Tax=Haliangium ochraceum (strain DSM 14365 / JCM 11303 / SMP-2) TaxID=502025 RepID=D0LJK1_HALO1|nr:hypothetical protein [Haliangium ochraceum]ACY16575.1 hypothetical protein Hoch_4077 [Haliangium ochraceum DSM 14365]
MSAGSGSRTLLIAGLLAAAALGAVLLWWPAPTAERGPDGDGDGDATAQTSGEARGQAHAPRPALGESAPAGAAGDPIAGLEGEPEVAPPTPAEAAEAYPVDLEALRARIPDNLYWQRDGPTEDPEELARREAEAEQRNQQLGKILSGTASEAEIDAYYDHRERLSRDYISFAKLVLSEYGEELPARDRGLYELSMELHAARLLEVPRKREQALQRKHEQDEARRAWRAERQP